MQLEHLVGGLGTVVRWQQGQAVPAMMGETGWKQVWNDVPKAVCESPAYWEWQERQMRKVGLKGRG